MDILASIITFVLTGALTIWGLGDENFFLFGSSFLGRVSLGRMDYSILSWSAAGPAIGFAVGDLSITEKLKRNRVKLIVVDSSE